MTSNNDNIIKIERQIRTLTYMNEVFTETIVNLKNHANDEIKRIINNLFEQQCKFNDDIRKNTDNIIYYRELLDTLRITEVKNDIKKLNI